MMRIVFLGPPGAGKGTQSSRLSKKLGIPKFSTGEIFRSEIKKDTDIGKKIKNIIQSGKLISDDIVNQIVYDSISCSGFDNGFILDGYPRTVDQARFLHDFLSKANCCIDAVIELSINDSIMFERIEDRISKAISSNGVVRSDDKSEIFLKRMSDYKEKMIFLSAYYRDIGCLYTIDGMADIETVSMNIDSVVLSIENKYSNG